MWRVILRLYPRAWRARYGEEMAALLERQPVTLATHVDLVLGAVDAALHDLGREGAMEMAERLRGGVITVMCAFVLFGLGFGLLARLGDPAPLFAAAVARYAGIGVLFSVVRDAAGLGALTLVGAGLPILVLAVRRAVAAGDPRVLRLLSLAVACAVAIAGATGALALWHPSHGVTAVALTFGAVCALLLALGTVAVARLVGAADLRERELRLAAAPAAVVAFAMTGTVAATGALLALIVADAPGLLVSQDVGRGMFAAGLVLMGTASLVAIAGVRRGWRDDGQGPAARADAA